MCTEDMLKVNKTFLNIQTKEDKRYVICIPLDADSTKLINQQPLSSPKNKRTVATRPWLGCDQPPFISDLYSQITQRNYICTKFTIRTSKLRKQ